LGKDLKSAQMAAYAAVEKIQFDGGAIPPDIAAEGAGAALLECWHV